MARTKSGDLKPWEKLLWLFKEGNVVSKDEIESVLANDIHIYKISSYIWDIKHYAKCVVRVEKQGRSVVGYQIVNVDVAKAHLAKVGADSFVPGQTVLKPSVSKYAVKPVKSLAALKAKPAKAVKTKAAKPAKVKAPAAPVIEDEVVEITE